MAPNNYGDGTIRQYLLGQLDSEKREELEQRVLVDDAVYETLMAGEDDVIDDYLSGALNAEERKQFETHFLLAPEHQERLRFARSLRHYISTHTATNLSAETPPASAHTASLSFWRAAAASSALRIAAGILVILGIGFGIWSIIFYQSDLKKGLVALNAAYSQERPIESRISHFGYAPYSTTRGKEGERVDYTSLDRAERILLDAAQESTGPDSLHALGQLYLTKKEFDKAIDQFQKAAQLAPNNAQIYADMGAAYLEKGKLEIERAKSASANAEPGKGFETLARSLENLNKALTLNPHLLEALFNRALCEEQMTLYSKAEEDWQRYLQEDSSSRWADEARQYLKLLQQQKARSSGSKEQLIADFLGAYRSQNDDGAWAALSRSRARTGNAVVVELVDAYLNLASSGRTAEADTQLAMLDYAGNVEDKKVQDKFTLDLARFYGAVSANQRDMLMAAHQLMKSATGNYNKAEWNAAIDTFSKARELFIRSGAESEKLFAEAWIGYCYLRVPDPGKTTATFQNLAKTFAAKSYKSLYAQALLALADTLNAQNEFSKVLEQANAALAVSEQIEDYANSVRCLQARTSIHLILGNYPDSLAAAYRALTLAHSLPPDAKLTWPFYHETSLDLFFLGLQQSALQFEDEALRLAISSGLSLLATRSYDRRALIFEGGHNYDEALKSSLEARSLAQTLSDEQTRTNVLAHSALNLARLYRETGDLQHSLASYDEALTLYKALGLNIYQYPAHKGKLLTLIALHDDAAAERELEATLFWYEQNREKIVEESFRDKFFDTDQNTYEVAVEFEYFNKDDSAKAFAYAETYRARSLLDLMHSGARLNNSRQSPDINISSVAAPLSLNEIQKRLPVKAQLLEYSVLNDRIVMWVITKTELKSAHIDVTRNEWSQKIRRYISLLSAHNDNETGEATRLAKELFEALIAPVKNYLNPDLQVCIIPDDFLNFLPFAALISPQSNRYLVEDYALEISPSATVYVTAPERPRPQNGFEQLLAVGNPNFDRDQFAGLGDLTGAEREAKEIARLYDATPLLGAAAAVTKVRERMGRADVIHLATHAVVDEQSPLLSKLLLSPDQSRDDQAHHESPGYLQASELYEIRLPNTRLVVLSACQTGIERAYRGEGAIGFARPFLVAGVPIVVASLWPVDSDATADLMISFHVFRKQQNLSPVDALRRAQLAYLESVQRNPQKTSNWAAFVAIGGFVRS